MSDAPREVARLKEFLNKIMFSKIEDANTKTRLLVQDRFQRVMRHIARVFGKSIAMALLQELALEARLREFEDNYAPDWGCL